MSVRDLQVSLSLAYVTHVQPLVAQLKTGLYTYALPGALTSDFITSHSGEELVKSACWLPSEFCGWGVRARWHHMPHVPSKVSKHRA